MDDTQDACPLSHHKWNSRLRSLQASIRGIELSSKFLVCALRFFHVCL
jgi:hypothetical protein